METFKQLLRRFDVALQKYNPVNYARLQAPLPSDEIAFFLNQIHIDHPHVRDLYEWKNGVNMSRGLGKMDMIFNFGVLFPLDWVVDCAVNFPHDNPNLIPLVGEFTGDCLLFNNGKGDDYGKIHVYSVSLLSIDDPYSYFDSIYSMLDSTIAGYESEALRYDDMIGVLDENVSKVSDIGRKLNPKSNWWTSYKV